MTKRRDFIKNSLGATAGITVAATGLGTMSSCEPEVEEQILVAKDWHLDPEWRKIKYGDWNGPGVPSGQGPMDHVLLKDYAPRSSMIANKTFVPKARYPTIDVHVHSYYPEVKEGKKPEEALADWVKTQEEVGIETSVVLTGATGAEFDRLVEMFLKPYPEQFQLYCGVLGTEIDKPDFPERAVAELERCYQLGARGVGELSDKGFGLTKNPNLAPEERLHNNDPRLDSFYRKCAELDLPVVIHMADHPSSWQPPDVHQERTPIFQQFNQYDGNGLSYDKLLDNLDKMLKKHPEATFVVCHLANLGNDLERLGKMVDDNPNMYLDMSARDYELGRQPRGSAKFLSKYSDRVLFGTDMGMEKSMYQNWWRLLESADEHITGRVWWRYYGLDLPDPVLEALYHDNAKRIMNWKEVETKER